MKKIRTPAEQFEADIKADEARAAMRRYTYNNLVNREPWMPGKFIFDHGTTHLSPADATLRSVANVTRIVINRVMVKK
jgi:hypothetical protein